MIIRMLQETAKKGAVLARFFELHPPPMNIGQEVYHADANTGDEDLFRISRFARDLGGNLNPGDVRQEIMEAFTHAEGDDSRLIDAIAQGAPASGTGPQGCDDLCWVCPSVPAGGCGDVCQGWRAAAK